MKAQLFFIIWNQSRHINYFETRTNHMLCGISYSSQTRSGTTFSITSFEFPPDRQSIDIMYESNPRVPLVSPATPGHLTRIKSRVGGNLSFVQVPVPRAFDTMKKTSQHLVYPNNMHQYQSSQQCKGLFSILFCNHVSSVKYRKQEQILKILDTMNLRSQFYNVLKYQ